MGMTLLELNSRHFSAMHLKFPSYNKYNMAADNILTCEQKYKFYTKGRSNCFPYKV